MSHAEQEMPSVMSSLPFWQRVLCRWADRVAAGRLTLQFEGYGEHVAVGRLPGPHAALCVRNAKPVFRILTGGTLGFAQAFIDGDLDSPDIGGVVEFALANEAELGKILSSSAIFEGIARLRHKLRRNSKKGSRRNIAFHYDLGNAFYSQWLDRTMTYSSALYETPGQSLAEAQEAKYARIVRELNIGPDDHVLEIGCGWGGFAEHAIRATGCRVTGLTLSVEQAKFARERLEKAGFADRVDIRLEDYRDCQGRFDKIVSIEMFEAVGEENWPVYFKAVQERLVPGGKAIIQTITIDESRFEQYRRSADFIQTYIFPGGMLPSITIFERDAARAGLQVGDRFRFGRDYDRTLIAWDNAFTNSWSSIEPLGFDRRFYRMWRLYLHYCAVGFRVGRIDVVQFRLNKPA
ncbi:cyclopropane-fatty-acyl-phospholipid synthase [Rhizobium sp. Root274]|uniref:SAM-dependent methyltransferase n=1 Tax=unclassified Rhizobium TaxID=2613769 RepID=UPI000713DD9A|nr:MULTISPECIES: cyclopropane-fatty-acyl-phospholipid synthase family protein [unclassified Rhizobium]KQW32127.1 cyclopropane-fatty-acyl-phospholipid synthase [Rhizobium sp. Root1240]KRD33666.1 cyclopropane-fatty-acyl-phospholipid synthase [Rhizobium sp. Root274]